MIVKSLVLSFVATVSLVCGVHSEEAPAPVEAVREEWDVHLVQAGETYASIAAARGVTEEALRKANENLELRPGRILRLPEKPEKPELWVPRMVKGHFYTVWYDSPRSFMAGLKERRAFVRVREIEGDWAWVDLYYSSKVAHAMCLVAELEKGSPAMEAELAKAGVSKEEFLKKAAEHALGRKEVRALWINLAKAEAIERLDPLAELANAEQEKGRKK